MPEKVSALTQKRNNFLMMAFLAIVTPVLLFFATEIGLGRTYIRSSRSLGDCLDYEHADAGIPNISNCKTVDKLYETPLVHYSFNECGLRSVYGCQPSSSDKYTIAMLGTSVGLGQWVNDNQSLSSQIEMDTANREQKHVVVANYSRMEEAPPMMVQLLPQILQKKPNMVIVILTEYDVKISTANARDAAKIAKMIHASRLQWWTSYLKTLWQNETFREIVITLNQHLLQRIEGTRLACLIENFDFKNNARYVHQYLAGDDGETGYLDPHPSAQWEASYSALANEIKEMSQLTNRSRIPLAVVLLPSHAQAIMLANPSIASEYPSYDPYYIEHRVKGIVEANGGDFVDIFPDCSQQNELGSHFYFENAHPDASALSDFAKMISKYLKDHYLPKSPNQSAQISIPRLEISKSYPTKQNLLEMPG